MKPFSGLCLILPPLVWMDVESKYFCYVSLGHYTICVQCILYLWEQSEAFPTSTISSWVSTSLVICDLPFFFVFLFLILFVPFIMLVGWMVHINSIKVPFHLVIGSTIPILDISGNLILRFLYSPVFKIVKSLNITLVGVPYFSVDAGMGYDTSSYLKCLKDRSFIFL